MIKKLFSKILFCILIFSPNYSVSINSENLGLYEISPELVGDLSYSSMYSLLNSQEQAKFQHDIITNKKFLKTKAFKKSVRLILYQLLLFKLVYGDISNIDLLPIIGVAAYDYATSLKLISDLRDKIISKKLSEIDFNLNLFKDTATTIATYFAKLGIKKAVGL